MRWDDLSHVFSFQSRRWVLWEGINAADTPGCRAVPWKGVYSPMPRRVSRNFSTPTGEQKPSGTLCETFFRAHQCGRLTAAEADSYWGWSQVSHPPAWRAVAQLHSQHADHMVPRWCIIAFIEWPGVLMFHWLAKGTTSLWTAVIGRCQCLCLPFCGALPMECRPELCEGAGTASQNDD